MKKNFLVIIFFWIATGVYLGMMAPGICADDSGELAGVAATLGIAHSPGYPLFALIGRIFNLVFGLGSPAYRTNLVAVVLATTGAAIIFLTLLRYSWMAAIFSGVFLLTNYFFINISVVTEVYGVAILLISLILSEIVYCFEENFSRPSRIILIAYLWALGIIGHYTIFFLFPVIAYLFLAGFKKLLPGQRKEFFILTLFFALLAFSVVFYIYWRARSNPVFSWEDPRTLKRFLGVIGRWRYGSLNLAQGRAAIISWPVIKEKIQFFFQLLLTGNGSFAFLITGLLVFIGWRKKNFYHQPFALLFGGFLFSSLAFLLMANVSVGKYSSELLARFFFLPMALLAVALGLAMAGSAVCRRWLGLILVIGVFWSGQKNISADNRTDFIYYDYARNILASLRSGAILFSDRADEMEFSLAYLLRVEHKRPDVNFIDCNAGVSRSIYGDDYYYIWGDKRLRIRTEVEKDWLKRYRAVRPIYYATFFPEMIAIKRYPSGLVFSTDYRRSFSWPEIYIYRYPKKNLDFRHQGLTGSYFQLLLDDSLARKDITSAEILARGLAAYSFERDIILSIAYKFFSSGNTEMAAHYFQQALTQGIQPAVSANNLGVIYKQTGKKSLAREFYKKSLSYDPNYAQAYYNLAVLDWEENNWPAVVDNLKKVLTLEPENSSARQYLQQAQRHLETK